MSDRIGLFTGSFDPVTKGHVDLIERAAGLFATLYVGVFYNKDKTGKFSLDQRLSMLAGALGHLPNVQLTSASNRLAVDVAQGLGVTHLVRGLRTATDLDYEEGLAYFNQELAPELETVFLVSRPAYRFLSSSRVRELLYFQQDISPYVPASVLTEMEKTNASCD